jgi:hypothetical protein
VVYCPVDDLRLNVPDLKWSTNSSYYTELKLIFPPTSVLFFLLLLLLLLLLLFSK